MISGFFRFINDLQAINILGDVYNSFLFLDFTFINIKKDKKIPCLDLKNMDVLILCYNPKILC